MAIKEFKTHSKRFFLTAFALGWGTLTVVILLAFGEGLKTQLTKADKGIGNNIMVVWGGQTSIPYNGLPQGRNINLTTEDLKLIINNIPEIEYISGEYNSWGTPVKYGRNTKNILLVGVNAEFGEIRNQIPKTGSRFINKNDVIEKRKVIFLGWKVAERIFDNENPVGKTLYIKGIPFTVIGVLKEKLQNSNYNNMDNNKAYIPYTTYLSMFNRKYYNNIVLSLRDDKKSKYVKKRLYEVLSKKYKFDKNDKMTLSIWDITENHKIINKIFIGIQIFLGLIGSLTLIISGVGLANIMYASIKHRTRDIGIKMALGAKKDQILKQIITESSFFALIGGSIGFMLSFLIVQIVKNIPSNNSAIEYLARPQVSYTIMILVFLLLSTIAFLSGFFPAKKAISQNPVEALRYE